MGRGRQQHLPTLTGAAAELSWGFDSSLTFSILLCHEMDGEAAPELQLGAASSRTEQLLECCWNSQLDSLLPSLCIHRGKPFPATPAPAPAPKCPLPQVALGTGAEHTHPAAGSARGAAPAQGWETGTGLAWLRHPGSLSMVLESSGFRESFTRTLSSAKTLSPVNVTRGQPSFPEQYWHSRVIFHFLLCC